MNRRLRLMLTAAIAGTIALALTIAAPASALQTYVGKVKLSSEPNLATFSANFGTRFVSIDSVCFTFGFAEADAFGPGDELEINLTPSQSFIGFFSVDGPDVTSRTVCSAPGEVERDILLAVFADGKQRDMTATAVTGSFTITSIGMTLLGTGR
jgi:hypothetical protein